MKKNFKTAFFMLSIIFVLASCGSVTRINRQEVQAPILYSTRDDISVTEDLTASGKVKTVSVLFVDFYRWNNSKRQLKIGPFRFLDRDYEEGVFNGYYGFSNDFDEKIAAYNFISQNSNLDYITNVRFKKAFNRKPFYWRLLNIGVRESETTVIAKGVILKNKVPAKK
jgi:hypothetical protein